MLDTSFDLFRAAHNKSTFTVRHLPDGAQHYIHTNSTQKLLSGRSMQEWYWFVVFGHVYASAQAVIDKLPVIYLFKQNKTHIYFIL